MNTTAEIDVTDRWNIPEEVTVPCPEGREDTDFSGFVL